MHPRVVNSSCAGPAVRRFETSGNSRRLLLSAQDFHPTQVRDANPMEAFGRSNADGDAAQIP